MDTFWSMDVEKCRTVADVASIQVEGGASSETPGILGALLNIFLKIKADLKFNEENRNIYREKVIFTGKK